MGWRRRRGPLQFRIRACGTSGDAVGDTGTGRIVDSDAEGIVDSDAEGIVDSDAEGIVDLGGLADRR